MTKAGLLVPLVLVLFSACTSKKNTVASSLPDMSAVRANLAFTCTHEADHLPALDPKADQLFQYARYLQKKDDPKDFNEIVRYYRIAAAYGHYKANHNAQLLISQGLADSPDSPKETITLAAQLVEQGVPGGYYDIGHYLEAGYGLKQDSETALRYFRKAADLGNPEAQTYVAEQLAPHDKAPDIAKQMRQCATDQGFGEAAGELGIYLQNDSLFPDAVEAFQEGVKAGDTTSVSYLGNGFKAPPSTDGLYYLALSNDPERSRRYRAIQEFLRANDGRNPKVPDIDKIVPLPPAKLPPWDGTFQWQRERDAAVPPQKPSEELIDQLAKAKDLDPATGLPLTASSIKTSRND
ncbi:SEL1-like repeat protein [Paraburkholderia sp.]|uniref:SEL1-like repeat protein n=1 Tax=Paraburkholderia sp. TaxID=1926495 RepID=UPI003D7005E1